MFGFPLWQIAAYSGSHLLLSGWVALAAYWWTSTTLSRTWPTSPTLAFFTRRLSFLLALSFALLAHIAEDYLIGWF
jgi:hypothetical protein